MLIARVSRAMRVIDIERRAFGGYCANSWTRQKIFVGGENKMMLVIEREKARVLRCGKLFFTSARSYTYMMFYL